MKEEWRYIFSKGVFEGEFRFMEPMKNHTSLRIGGPADVFVIPQDPLSLRNLQVNFKKMQIPYFPLGGGTNILVKDGGIEGVVISFKSFKRIEVIREDNKYVDLSVEAGTPLQGLVNFSKWNGYSGIEGLTGIPGTVGGAVCGNAGAFGYEMKAVLISVWMIDAEGRLERFKAEDIDFGYRRSGISPAELLLSAEIRLMKDKKEDVSARVDSFLKEKRKRQPISAPSAGCVFKNPDGLSAGKLIDEAGCKGMRIGDVEVSNLHANFFINKGEAKASDFIRLMEKVALRVKEKFGIVLEPEIRIIGRDA
ncbi:MAG: UDP-N-acetylmuramate dehydrogenase [Nitrospirae bacterium]|nr:UDP-N-acetylmuramate dehydrogenase [Nitrospirota bacterium]